VPQEGDMRFRVAEALARIVAMCRDGVC